MNLKKAESAINRAGVLLVYPVDNRPEPPSLWSALFPRSPMRWEWDGDGDDRVAALWHLRAELSSSNRVVYTKWFRGRATFFSREMFRLYLAALRRPSRARLGEDARRVLEALELDSPLSTKQLKRAVGLQGRASETAYTRALRELWAELLIVGYGEVDDGAFPSLALGATRVLYEDLWQESRALDSADAREEIFKALPRKSLFLKGLGPASVL